MKYLRQERDTGGRSEIPKARVRYLRQYIGRERDTVASCCLTQGGSQAAQHLQTDS